MASRSDIPNLDDTARNHDYRSKLLPRLRYYVRGTPQYNHRWFTPGSGAAELRAIQVCLEKSKPHHCDGSEYIDTTNNEKQEENVHSHGVAEGSTTQTIDPQNTSEMICADRPYPLAGILGEKAIGECLQTLENAGLWRNGSTLPVHFKNYASSRIGPRMVSSHVQNALERYANIKFQFGAPSNSALIRIEFKPSDCVSYSYVGRRSINASKDTMNLAIRDLKGLSWLPADDEEARGIILHGSKVGFLWHS